jgi:hypothetical protein
VTKRSKAAAASEGSAIVVNCGNEDKRLIQSRCRCLRVDAATAATMEFADRGSPRDDDVQGLLQDLSNMKLTEENLMAHTQRAAELSPQPDIAPSPCRIITMSSRGVALTGGDFTPKRFADVENLAVLVTGWPQELSLDEKDALLAPFSAVGSLHSWVPDAPDGEQPWEETALVIFGARLHATKACSSKKLDSRLTARPVRETSPEMLAVLKKMPLSVPAGPKLDSTAAARVISFTLKQRNPAAATAAAERIAAARRARESAAAAKERLPAAAVTVAAPAAAVTATPAAAATVVAAAASSSPEARNEQPVPAEQQQSSSEQTVPVQAAGDHSINNNNAKRSSGRGRGRGRRRSTAGVKSNSASASTAHDSSTGTAAQRTAPDAASATAAHGTAQRSAPVAAARAAVHGTASETAHDTATISNAAVSGADRGRGGRGSGRRRRGRGRGNRSLTDSQPQQQQQQQQHDEHHESNAYDPDVSWS